MLTDTLRKMKDDGVKRALGFVTSAYSSYSSCGQYRGDIAKARSEVGPGAPEIDKIRLFYNHPEFIHANVEHVRDALAQLPADQRGTAQIVFTAHSIPKSMAETCAYESHLMEASRLVAEALDVGKWKLVYQSRSGPPSQPWLGPDVCDALSELRKEGVKSVVISPIGFVSDHLEVLYDLDTEAKAVCEELGLSMIRAATASTHPRCISMIRQLIEERLHDGVKREALGTHGSWPDGCKPSCCSPPKMRPRQSEPASGATQ